MGDNRVIHGMREAVRGSLTEEIRLDLISSNLANSTSIGFKKDREGNTVITRLNEVMLQQIAAAGNGDYVRANNTQAGLSKIFEKIDALEKSEIETRMFTDYEDQFQYFLGFGLLLIFLEFLIFDRKTRWAGRIKLFDRENNKLN